MSVRGHSFFCSGRFLLGATGAHNSLRSDLKRIFAGDAAACLNGSVKKKRGFLDKFTGGVFVDYVI
jgi:hypothetical protein